MMEETKTLEGHFLISMPGLEDGLFSRAVIYLCAHSSDGAMGLIINKPSDRVRFSFLLSQLAVLPTATDGLPEAGREMIVLDGGPVEPGRGFVLHSTDYLNGLSTVMMGEQIALTATLDVLRAIANGSGPKKALFCLGYAGWAPGQLEQEMQANSWLSVRASQDILFETDYALRYESALRSLGIEPALLSMEAGHA